MTRLLSISCIVAGLLVANLGFAVQEDDDKAKETKKNDTVQIKSESMVVYETLSGVIQSSDTSEVKADIKSWADLEIKRILDEGTEVRKGQEILWFETEKLDLAIQEAEIALESAELDHKEAEIATAQAEVEFKLNNDLNSREMEQAREDYKYYQEVTRPERMKDLDYRLKSSNYFLEYAQEELNQLLKMYNEDEMTEESEKIVLKRAQRSVESSERNLRQTTLSVNRERNVEMPRNDIQRSDALKRQALIFEKKKQTLPYNLERSKISLEKSTMALDKTRKKLKELKEARQQMTLKAPSDGILYYGRCVRGKWMGASGSTTTTLEPGKKIPAKKVICTIVNPSKLVVRTDVDEDKIRFVKAGSKGTAVMKKDKSLRMPVSVKAVKRVPMTGGKFDCMFEIDQLNNSNLAVLPAMNCKISMKVYENDKALVAPKTSVFSDDGISHYVYLAGDEPKKRKVEVGLTNGDNIEILSGVSKSTVILKKKPS